jgi:hypothetical protein
MPKVAVIQDGAELARQSFADVAGSFDECMRLLSADGTSFSLRMFTDEAVGPLLDSIHSDEFACLVFASNSLNSSQVERALERRKDELRDYLEAGGGIVVLHQVQESLTLVLPDGLRPDLADRVHPYGTGSASPSDAGDVLLNYPVHVETGELRDGGAGIETPALFSRSMRIETLPEKLKPVLTYEGELVLARSYDHVVERVVIATMPLEWQRATGLLADAIRFAALGRPRRLVWRAGAGTSAELLVRWLSMDGDASVRAAPEPTGPIGEIERWLLANVDLVVVPPEYPGSLEGRPEVTAFLARGGTLLTADRPTVMSASRITALIGEYTERSLAARLHAELRAITGWDTAEFAFELRNIVGALAFLWRDEANRTPGAVSPAELRWLSDDILARLGSPFHRLDLSSSIALAQAYGLLEEPRRMDATAIRWMRDVPRAARFDVALPIRAVGLLWEQETDPGFLAAAAGELAAHETELVSLVPLLRVLDAVTLLDESGLLAAEPAAAQDLLDLTCRLLERFPADPDVGWLSTETTADVTRGLIALLNRLAEDDGDLLARAIDHLATGVVIIRRAMPRAERTRKGVAWRARLTHAVVLAERRFPTGLHRLATLDWPEGTTGATTVTSASLLDQINLENKNLRRAVQEAERDKLPAKLGRATATLLPTLLLAVLCGYGLALIGFGSPWDLLANVAVVLTVLLAVVAGIFTLLARMDLLAEPAERVRRWILEVVPLVSELSRLKRRG